MNLNGILNIGISGLLTQSTKIGTVSNNIANVNTVGYKGFTTDFLSLVQGNSNAVFETLYGAKSNTHQYNSRQGEIATTESTTDIAINGNGMFAVTANTEVGSRLLYTRAGTFAPDQEGNMRNSAGFYLQGWKLDSTGALPAALQTEGYDSATALSSLELVNVSLQDSLSVPTSKASIVANLKSDQTLYNPTGNITFASNPTAGDTVTINGVTWTFVASGATGAQTNIGSNLDFTVTNLVNDLTASGNPAVTAASYSNIGGNTLKVIYDSTNGAASTFNLASSSINATPTQLLLYNSAIPGSNMNSGAVQSQFNRSASIVDNNGVEHEININFLKTAVNTWAVEIGSVPASGIRTAGGQIAVGTLTFNGDGSLHKVSPALTSSISFPWSSTGSTPTTPEDAVATIDNNVTFDWGTAGEIFGTPGSTSFGQLDGVRQLATDYVVNSLTQDGHASGSLQKIQVTDNGTVTAFYSNGATQDLYRIPLAKFINVDGLDNESGTAYSESSTSGFINLFVSGDSGVGKVISGALENSNVDLSSELTDIIIAQRAYQSNTKTVTTTDDMLKTITDMLR